jgi:hypothetical protein
MSAVHKEGKKVNLGFVSIHLIKSNIVCFDFLTNEEINVEKGVQIIETAKTLIGDITHASIINAPNIYTPSDEFFKFILSQRSATKDNVITRGIVTKNLAQVIEAQNFINSFKPLTPTKLFKSMEDALAWIEPQLKEVI